MGIRCRCSTKHKVLTFVCTVCQLKNLTVGPASDRHQRSPSQLLHCKINYGAFRCTLTHNISPMIHEWSMIMRFYLSKRYTISLCCLFNRKRCVDRTKEDFVSHRQQKNNLKRKRKKKDWRHWRETDVWQTLKIFTNHKSQSNDGWLSGYRTSMICMLLWLSQQVP